MTIRKFLVLLCLTPVVLYGQVSEKTSVNVGNGKPLASGMSEDLTVPGQKNLPVPDAGDAPPRTAAELVQLLARREQARLDEHERSIASELDRIRAAGGFQALLRTQLAEADKQERSGPQGGRAAMISAELRARLASFAVCQTPTLHEASGGYVMGYVIIGSSMNLFGCHLGEAAGTISLYAPGTGMNFAVTPIIWRDDYIHAAIEGVSGIQDQPGVLLVTLPSGAISNGLEVLVKAQRDSVILAARPNSNVTDGGMCRHDRLRPLSFHLQGSRVPGRPAFARGDPL